MPSRALRPAIIPRELLLPFLYVTLLFPLWGFANDITNPMVSAFQNILLLSHFESALVQAAFYGGYCVMAIPAALMIRRTGYKTGILTGLALYASGCFLFLPAGWSMAFGTFLAAYFIMTCGLSFLETSANPYVLSMGPQETATRRLNFSQAFNPMGSLLGMWVAKEFILARLDPAGLEKRRELADSDAAAFNILVEKDLDVIVIPYVVLGVVVLIVLTSWLFRKMPDEAPSAPDHPGRSVGETLRHLWNTPHYREGVVAQVFYVGAQIMCWTFIIQYAVSELGMSRETAQGWNIAAMIVFVSSRFVCTFLLKFIDAGRLLMWLSIGGGLLTFGVITLPGMAGLYCLVAVSACMSLMFPTIYGIALQGLKDDAKLGSAGLIAAIGGGCALPPLQGAVMDGAGITLAGLEWSAVRVSFLLPVFCFLVIALYGFRSTTRLTAKS